MTPLQKRIDSALRALPDLPAVPVIDWAAKGKQLSEKLQLKIDVEQSAEGWHPRPTTQMGRVPLVLSLNLPGKPGRAAFVMSRADVAKCSAWLVTEQAVKKATLSEGFQEGFLRFLALEIAHAMKLPIAFCDEELSEQSYCVDLTIRFQDTECVGRIALSGELHELLTKSEEPIAARLPPSLDVPVAIRIGTLSLTREELQAARPGDALVLPAGAWDPRHGLGEAMLLLGAHPIAAVTLSQERADLLEVPLVDRSGLQVESERFSLPLQQLHESSIAVPLSEASTFSIRHDGEEVARAQLLYIGELPCLQLVGLSSP